MRASGLHAVAVAVLLVASSTGCDRQKTAGTHADAGADAPVTPGDVGTPDAGPPPIIHADGPMPGPDAVLGRAGPYAVTLADYDHATHVSLLFSPDPSITSMTPQQLAAIQVHFTLTRALLRRKIVVDEAHRRGLKVDDAEIEAFLKKDDKLHRFAGMSDAQRTKALARYGLTRADLRQAVTEELLQQKLTDALLDAVDDGVIWKA